MGVSGDGQDEPHRSPGEQEHSGPDPHQPGDSRGSILGLRPRSTRARHPKRLWITVAGVMAALLFVISAVVGQHVWHKPTFYGFDEQGHLDYVEHLANGELPRWGDLYTPETVHLLNCLGIVRSVPQPCVDNTDPARYPPQGYSYEAQQPPLAYVAYVPFLDSHASPVAALDAARRGGLVWMAVALALLVAVALMANLSVVQTAALLSLCALNPMAVQASATVTNDSAGLAAGAASIAMIQIGRRRGSTMAVPALALGLAIGLLKGLFVVAPLALLLGGLLTEHPRRSRPSMSELWRRHGCALSMFAGSVASAVGFVLIQDARAAVKPIVVLTALLGGQVTARPRWSTIERSLGDGFSGFDNTQLQPLYSIWNILVYGSVLGVLINQGSDRLRSLRALVGGTLIALVLLALGFTFLDYFQGHFDYYTPARYFLPLIPILAFVVARASHRAALLVTGVAVPAVAVGSTLFGHPF